MHPTIRAGLAALAMTMLAPAAHAQARDEAALAGQRAAIGKLKAMNGIWRGPAVTRGPAGEHRVTQTERIGDFLEGSVKLIEGKGYNDDGSIGFHAFGVLSWDETAGHFWMTSNAQGKAGKFKLVATANGYVWEIPQGPGRIVYTARIDGTKWNEVGDFVMPGQPARRFFEMNLVRLGDTDWPEAGGVPMK